MTLRILGAAALLVSAAVHLIEWFSGVRNQSIGPLFLVNVVAGVVIAALLIWWEHWVPAFLTLGFGAATLGAFVLSTTVGLLGVHSRRARRATSDAHRRARVRGIRPTTPGRRTRPDSGRRDCGPGRPQPGSRGVCLHPDWSGRPHAHVGARRDHLAGHVVGRGATVRDASSPRQASRPRATSLTTCRRGDRRLLVALRLRLAEDQAEEQRGEQ
jgi:hypothetical protein